jgi:hypothetical protein
MSLVSELLNLIKNFPCVCVCIKFRTPETSDIHKEFHIYIYIYIYSSDSSVGIALGYGLDDRGSRVRGGLYRGCSNGVPPIHFFQAEHRIQFRSRPMRFLGFSNHEKGAPRQEILKLSTVCSTFSRTGWSVVRSASLAKVGTSKKRPSPHLHKVPTRSNKVSPRTLQTVLIHTHTNALYRRQIWPWHSFWLQQAVLCTDVCFVTP